MNPKVSLIIPIYNAQEFLQPCLDSVLQQTIFPDVEVVLIDDGSKDDSPAICDAFAKDNPNVLVIHKENGGVSVARNTGIQKASGKYLAFADADDLLMPEMLEKLCNAAENTGAQMAFCAFEHPYPDKNVTIQYPFMENVPLNREYIRTKIAKYMIVDEAFNALWNKLFLRSVVTEHDILMTEGKKYAEDREFILRFLTVADCVCYVPYVGYYYRYVQTGAIQKPRTDYADQLVERHWNDCSRFADLGFDKETYSRLCAGCLCSRIAGALAFAEKKSRGKTRRVVLKAILDHAELQTLLSEVLPFAKITTFEKRVLSAMRKRSVAGLRFLFFAMRLKVGVYNILKGRH